MYGGISFSRLLVVDPFFEWDGSNWIGHPTPGPGRNLCDLVSTPWSGKVLLRNIVRLDANGANAYSYLPETWEYDGATWIQMTPASWPGHRYGPAMSADTSRQQVVFFGGGFDAPVTPVLGESSRSPSPDPLDKEWATWTFANGQWRREPTNPPFNLEIVGAAPDPRRARSVLLARKPLASPGSYDFETWVHEDGGFHNLQLPSHPAYRAHPAFAYHPDLDRWVMYGGMLGAYATGETWVFDGTSWVQDLRPAPPTSPDGGSVMTYDRHRRVLVMKQNWRNEIWEYGAAGWSQRVEATLSFTNHRTITMVYDSTRRRLIAAGFFDPAQGLSYETWEFDGQSWQQNATATYTWQHAYALLDVPELGGVVAFPREWQIAPRQYVAEPWLYDGTTWRPLDTEFGLYNGIVDRAEPFPVYDRRLGRVRVFTSTLTEFPTGSQVWDLVDRTLYPTTHQPRLGERIGFRFDVARLPNTVGIVGLSFGRWPGIDIGSADGRAIPLANDGAFQISLGLGLIAVLDSNGAGSVQLAPIPNDPVLLDTQLFAAGAVMDPATGWVGHVTNPVAIRVVP